MDPGGQTARKWNQIFFIAMMISLFIDPLFFFSPTIRAQKDRFCVENEAFLDSTFVILRSLNDVFYWLHMLFQFKTAYVAPSSRVFGIGELIVNPTRIALRYLTKAFWLDLLAALPIPQVLVWAVIPNVNGSMTWDLKIVLRFLIFFQYFFRFYSLYPLSLQAMNATGIVSETIWLRTASDLLLFYVASHISGACWYLFTIERQEECWKSACNQERQSCGYDNFYCSNGWFESSNVTRLCDPNSGYYQFGVYALGVTTGASSLPFAYKYSYALWIGLQAICWDNWTPSLGINHNKYAKEWRLKRNDIEEWMHNRQLPPELKQHVQRLDPALYTEGTFLVREGDPVNEISFIIRGQLDSYTTDNNRSGFFSSAQISSGGFCGEELFTWVLDSCSSDSFPPSTRTIRAISDVETFCLKAEDLKFVASQFHTLHSRNLRHKFKLYSQQWRTWAACYIQAAWRCYKMRKIVAEVSSEVCGLDTLGSREDCDMGMFVPRPDAGIEVYAARVITNLRREKSKRFSSDSERFSHSVVSVESQESLDHVSSVS
ncbi:putative cyclic nucleotide-gated ion channel 15 [Bienertia sinuspersici]